MDIVADKPARCRSTLASDTEVEGSDDKYICTLHPNWNMGGPLGGYIAAVSIRAAAREAEQPFPLSYHCQFLSTAGFGETSIDVHALQRGRSTETFEISMFQQEKLILRALLRTGRHRHPAKVDASVPACTDPDRLASLSSLLGERLSDTSIWHRIDTKLEEEDCLAWLRGGWDSGPIHRSWHRLPEQDFSDPYLDAGRQMIFLDLCPFRAAGNAFRIPRGEFQAKTLDFTVSFVCPGKNDEWLLASAVPEMAEDFHVGTDIKIWNSRRELICYGGSQLICRSVGDQRRRTAA